MPKPSSRASTRAPRARALSSVSSTKTAAPSPSTMPLRAASNGRQPSGDRTRSPSQALTPPKHSIASVPPASITSAAPARSSCSASPSAWLALEQAEDTAKTGPVSPWRIEICEAGALCISRGTTSGGTRDLPSRKTAR